MAKFRPIEQIVELAEKMEVTKNPQALKTYLKFVREPNFGRFEDWTFNEMRLWNEAQRGLEIVKVRELAKLVGRKPLNFQTKAIASRNPKKTIHRTRRI